ncbi:MAG: dienelactone hydrolase family protein [Candidatus Hydrogenedentes bacterium]|nr:dienelactone hydrolase family protein [Candidatus Hydrogenedentota bacterium]
MVVAPGVYPALYPGVVAPNLKAWPALESSRQFHIDSMASATLLGDDFGNVTSMPLSGAYGMNRLNHCPPIFHAYYAHGDARLRELALHWCNNFHDLSIWWGDEHAETFGGTRYNNRSAANPESPVDPNFMWRSNDAVHFCTKGYDSFFYAWEETGDPRMAAALRWQVDYASRIVHANQGEARNIGDVLDFTRLYEFTHEQLYLDNALRLFRELREKLSPGDLFSQSGAPIVSESPFLDVDAEGYQYPFAKPYIIGYALAGLPALAVHAPDEPKLNDVIRAVANFLAESQDPLGGWRYPHPRSSRVLTGQAIEHGAQIVRAAAWLEAHGEPIAPLLDAIERTLQARLGTYLRSGKYFNSLDGWERSTGAVAAGTSVQPLYAHPEDRDPARDYTEGVISLGDNSPEGVVYFEEVLDFYLRHRPAERLLNVTSQLAQVLTRIGPVPAPPARAVFPGFAIEQNLPTFNEAQKATLKYPLSWLSGNHTDFPAWRTAARAKLFESLLTPPPRAEFDPEVVAVENRGSYEARKLLLNISAYCRVPAYLLVPQGTGPFPAVVTLHDHGAHFSIGKEKVVRPFGVSEAVLADATDWVNKYYGQRWIGDALAEQGYVVFALDALFWGERGRKEGVEYKEQQTLSANLIQIGMTWPGVITWDDVRSAEFVASLPEVDPARIGAMGLSMGCHRTWTLCAATDRIAAGVAICWMGTTDALMVPGNNQTTGQSAYSMLVPNLRNYLDYPDVTSIACPKPMLFFNGTEDALFPVPGVEDAYARMHQIWESQGAADKLLTKLWPVPHEYNAAMQDEAFAWLAKFLMP